MAQPAMLDQVPQLGHVPKLFKAMTSRNDAIPKSALQIVHQLAGSEVSPISNFPLFYYFIFLDFVDFLIIFTFNFDKYSESYTCTDVIILGSGLCL